MYLCCRINVFNFIHFFQSTFGWRDVYKDVIIKLNNLLSKFFKPNNELTFGRHRSPFRRSLALDRCYSPRLGQRARPRFDHQHFLLASCGGSTLLSLFMTLLLFLFFFLFFLLSFILFFLLLLTFFFLFLLSLLFL